MTIPWNVEIERVVELVRNLINDDSDLYLDTETTSSHSDFTKPKLTVRYFFDGTPIVEISTKVFFGADEIGQIEMSSISDVREIMTLRGKNSGPFSWSTTSGESVSDSIKTFIHNAKIELMKMN